jgi:hypothetical protein
LRSFWIRKESICDFFNRPTVPILPQYSLLIDNTVVEERLFSPLPSTFEGEQERLSFDWISVPQAALSPGKSHELKLRLRIYSPEAYEDTTRPLTEVTPTHDWTSQPMVIEVKPVGSRQPFFGDAFGSEGNLLQTASSGRGNGR